MSIVDGTNFDLETEKKQPYVISMVGSEQYAISCKRVDHIIQLEHVTIVPMVGTKPYVRGIMDNKGKMIYLIDLRKALGYKSHEEEIAEINIEQRIKDHEDWVNALEKSVRDGNDFTLTDDPTKCTFGKWLYPALVTNNQLLIHELKKIEVPHDIIHSSAKRIRQLMKESKQVEALSIIENLRNNEVNHVINLLRSLKGILLENLREIVVIVETETGKIGLIFDSVNGMEQLQDIPNSNILHSSYVDSIKQRIVPGSIDKKKSLVLELNFLRF